MDKKRRPGRQRRGRRNQLGDNFTVSIKVPNGMSAEVFLNTLKGALTVDTIEGGRVYFILPLLEDKTQVRVSWGRTTRTIGESATPARDPERSGQSRTGRLPQAAASPSPFHTSPHPRTDRSAGPSASRGWDRPTCASGSGRVVRKACRRRPSGAAGYAAS